MIYPTIYIHKKTGNRYDVHRVGIINSTNAQNGERMVLYRRLGELDPIWYIREESEFAQKFEVEP